jgi:group II intron reverse transcriptase/maturase
MAKSPVEQRESEGIVVPSTVATNNATRGKGPCGGCVEGAGKRKGMDGQTVPNSPHRRTPMDNVRQLQRRLWAAAKRSPGRRFHALYDRIFRRDVLEEAWKRVKRNRGSSGVDSVTLAEVEVYGVERLLEELAAELRDGTYHPLPARRVYLPKPDGKKRPLGIPAVRDRVVQMATKLVLEPIFEAGFLPCSFGFRPKRGATQALEMLRRQGAQCNHALDADIRDFFGSIDHGKLMKLLERRISDRRVLKLLTKWLEAGVMEEGRWHETTTGAPQGAVISPLLSNIFLHVFDLLWERQAKGVGVLVRYADDFVVLCRSGRDCEQAEAKVREIFARLGLQLHPDKTRRVDLSRGRQGFDFLGCHLRKRMSGPIWMRERRHAYFLHRWPSAKSMKRVRQRIREETARSRQGARDVREVIKRINPVLRGWGSYFQTGNAAQKFNQVDAYVFARLRRFLVARKGRNLRPGDVLKWDRSFFESHGLHRLRGTVKYPGVA